jgi:hypothetical protein
MAFDEMDQAQAEAAQINISEKRGKKRQNATVTRLQPQLVNASTNCCSTTTQAMATNLASSASNDGSNSNVSVSGTNLPTKSTPTEAIDLRTGRWTVEETAYCDKLFEAGLLPIPDGIKLNDFLSGMLKSKHSRLTKKMKNAKLSARQYQRTIGHIANDVEAQEFSSLETLFFESIRCNMERSEIRFHMQKEWRELFSSFCLAVGQPLEADHWLISVEEMDRRASVQRDAARMARRKVMMGYALHQDSNDQAPGVFIDSTAEATHTNADHMFSEPTSEGESTSEASRKPKRIKSSPSRNGRGGYSPFITKILDYIQRNKIPFGTQRLCMFLYDFV